ncbi:MAG: hypothetical protein QOD53_1417 [Thermoleophilaceae bacterium]|nr:hypothetical protein [Thermoleophilaceae bacterium]
MAGACLWLAVPAEATFPGRNGVLAYQSLAAQPAAPPAPAGIWTVRPDGSHRQALVRGRAYLEDPAWSPDGRRVVYTRWKWDSRGFRDGRPGVWIVNADGRARRRLFANGFAPSWSPDGRHIALLRNAGGARELWIVDTRKGSKVRIAASTGAEVAEWSPDGSIIAYATQASYLADGAVWTVGPDGSAPRVLAALPHGEAASISWAPDASALVFGLVRLFYDCSYGCSTTYSVARVERDSGAVRTLVPEVRYDRVGQPVWSPDGASISYCRDDTGPHRPGYDRWAMRPDGTGRHYVSPSGCGADWQRRPHLHKALPAR